MHVKSAPVDRDRSWMACDACCLLNRTPTHPWRTWFIFSSSAPFVAVVAGTDSSLSAALVVVVVVVVDLLLPAALVVACNGLSSPAPSASPASFDVVVGTSPLACSSADLALPVVVAVVAGVAVLPGSSLLGCSARRALSLCLACDVLVVVLSLAFSFGVFLLLVR